MLPDGSACPRCHGEILTIGRRSWCMKPYAVGGCGAFWQGGKLQAWSVAHPHARGGRG